MTVPTLVLDEIFVSLQGEGRDVGLPQLFLRLGGCPLRCRYCDTPRSWVRRPVFELHAAEGTRLHRNPLSISELETLLGALARSRGLEPEALPLAVTGGEPLAQCDFLEAWLPTWPAPVLLETAGIWPERLQRLLPALDRVSLDFKLPTSLRIGSTLSEPWACLAVLKDSACQAWVKLVLGAEDDASVVHAILERMSREAPGTLVYLQPCTPVPEGPTPPPAARLLELALWARALPLEVRVQPQMHPVLGLR